MNGSNKKVVALIVISIVIINVNVIESHSYARNDIKLSFNEITNYINSTWMHDIITTIASDEFEGRYPGTRGDNLTLNFIENQLREFDIDPLGKSESYRHSILNGLTSNILAELSTKETNKTIIISAHHDHLGNKSGTIYNGANDNASGVSVVLEIAKILRELIKLYYLRMNIIFAFWGAEEIGYLGSQQFISNKFPEKYNKSIELVINLDEVGFDAGDHTLWVSGGLDIPEDYEMKFRTASNESKITLLNMYHSHGGSDHQSFLNVGIPAITLVWTAYRPYWHTPEDTAEKINNTLLEKTAHVVLNYLINQIGIFTGEIPVINTKSTYESSNTDKTNSSISNYSKKIHNINFNFTTSIFLIIILIGYKRTKRN